MSSLSDSWSRLKVRAGDSDPSSKKDDPKFDLAKTLEVLRLRNIATLKDVAAENLTKEPIDDRTYLQERIVELAAELPIDSMTSQTLTNSFLSQLWGDLEHPPKSYLGNDFVFRKADGSNNNFLWPHVGRAGQPYARSVKAIDRQPVARPDPGVIFDSVLKRKTFKEHPNRLSSVLFYVASIIIHDCFHTNHDDFNISDTSSYLDLSPLYGNDEKAQRTVRTMRNGKLKPDCFADPRILGFPPGVGALLIFFNRFHNNVADKLAEIDEKGRFSQLLRPKKNETETLDANGEAIHPTEPNVLYDEALFQTARLVTSGLYINIILKDYVRTILNLNRVDSAWNLDPRSPEGKALFGDKIPEGTGNQVSAEFNLIYRWHSCISERDAEWTQDVYQRMSPGGDTNHVPSMHEFLEALKEWNKKLLKQSPELRDFAGLTRSADGSFMDDDLANIWTRSVEDVSGAFGANHVPEVLRPVEILGIIQARSWNLASLNELRKYFKLQPWTSFKDINPDPEVANQLELLYEHPDNVELYPGVILEATKKPMDPGSGLCTNFTISRAILSDAVALVRGDRLYTVDYTTSNLTNYGYSMADSDLDIDYGCVFYKLILGALPNHYLKNSIYAHHPLTIPSENKKILTKIGRAHVYDFESPDKVLVPVVVSSHATCKIVFENASKVRHLPGLHATNGLTGNEHLENESLAVLPALREHFSTVPHPAYVRQFFEKITTKLIFQNTHQLAGSKRVDIIRDVVNLSQVHFAACLFALPLKTDDNPSGKLDAAELWAGLVGVYSCIHAKQDPVESFKAQQVGEDALSEIGKDVENTVRMIDSGKHGIIASILDRLHDQDLSDLTDQSAHLLQKMLKLGVPPDQLVHNYLLPIAAQMVVAQARAFADCIDYFLGPGVEHLPELRRLSLLDNSDADVCIEQHAMEAIRISSRLKVYTRMANTLVVHEDGKQLGLPADEIVQCNLITAHQDSSVFVNPDNFDTERAIEDYLPGLPGYSPEYPGLHLGRSALVGMLKIVSRLEDLRRCPGAQGRMKKMTGSDGSQLYLEVDEEAAHMFPSSMKVNYR